VTPGLRYGPRRALPSELRTVGLTRRPTDPDWRNVKTLRGWVPKPEDPDVDRESRRLPLRKRRRMDPFPRRPPPAGGGWRTL